MNIPFPTVPYGTVDLAYAERLTTTPPDEDGPVWMVNLMSYRDRAEYSDGRPTDLTGRQADDLYAPFESLAAVGAEIVFFAEVESQLLGDEPSWDRVAVVKYPTRRAFMEMQERPDFVAAHPHKEAGMAATQIIGTVPFTAPALPDDIPDWADVPHPPTPEDPPVMVIHVLRFNEGGASGDMVDYQNTAGRVAVPHGVRLAGWFNVDGVAVGDGRSWDQVRFNAFPSKAAFLAVVFDPERMAVHRGHREPAIADTYTMILRPLIDRLAASIKA